MKKIFVLISVFVIMLCLSACGSTDDTTNTESHDNSTTVSTDTSIIDLSSMSTTMAYSQAVEMANNYNKYINKTVKITGKFTVYETSERNYYICNVGDATACCSAGFEFSLSDTNLKYPDDYPKLDEEITVQGTFTTYKEEENVYVELKDAVLIK